MKSAVHSAGACLSVVASNTNNYLRICHINKLKLPEAAQSKCPVDVVHYFCCWKLFKLPGRLAGSWATVKYYNYYDQYYAQK